MKLTDAAQACISQAHMQRMSAGLHENLCVEHIFFALLALARYQTLCKGLHAAGLNELTQTLDNAGCPVLYELLEPRYCEAHNIPCRPEEEMPKEK